LSFESGSDAGKKINGKKRHILVDTLGLLLDALVHPADIQDREGGMLVLSTLFGMYPFLQKLFADGGYQGQAFRKAIISLTNTAPWSMIGIKELRNVQFRTFRQILS